MPYPGVYVKTSLAVDNVNENDTVKVIVRASNLGYENITGAWADIDVLGPEKELITTLQTLKMDLLSKKRDQVYQADWDSVGFGAGDYQARARFYYKDNVSVMQRDFKIGALLVQILNHTSSVAYATISPYDVIVKSGWNSPIENVYAIVVVNQTSFQTPSISLDPWRTETLKGYFDSKGFQPNRYPAEITVYYKMSSTTVKAELEVLPPPKKSILEQPTLVLGGIIALLVALAVLAIIFLGVVKRRKKQK